jgi:hypothetical protein
MDTCPDFDPQVGDLVRDCRGVVGLIAERDDDDVIMDDGFGCSIIHCLEPVNIHVPAN